jgi:chromosome segregation ATPase
LALLAGIATLALVIRAVCFLAAQVTLPLAEKQKKKPSQHGTPEQERAMTDAELIAMARLAQRDERMSTGALYGDLADRIEALTKQLAAARQDAKAAEDELEMQEQEACMMENDYIKLEKERDALEAKLAKAVEALEDIVKDCEADYPPSHGAIKYFARATLAEIKGESHE